jgi:hypothetical protein
MIDLRAPRLPLTVHLPAELIAELEQLAQERQVPVAEVVLEACLAHVESHGWERVYREWQQTHPPAHRTEGELGGEDLDPTTIA